MNDIVGTEPPADDSGILLYFDNGKPITATQLANLLRAFNSDYKKLTRGELFVSRVETGSFWIWLKDTAEALAGGIDNAGTIIGASARIAKFLKAFKQAWSSMDEPNPNQDRLQSPVDKSLAAVLVTAVECQANAELRQRVKPDGTVETFLKVTSQQAKQKVERLRRPPRAKSVSDALSDALLPSATPSGILDYPSESFASLKKQAEALGIDSPDLDSLVEIMVSVVSGERRWDLLRALADAYEKGNRPDIAKAIRKRVDPKDPSNKLLL